MDKLWLIAKQEYKNRAFQRSFIIGTLIIPVMITIIIGVTTLIIIQSEDNRPLGYVDLSGAIHGTSIPKGEDEPIEIIPFIDQESANEALDDEEIQGFIVISENYLTTQFVDLYYLEEAPSDSVLQDFDDFVRVNILQAPPTDAQFRITEGTKLKVQALNDQREFEDNETGIFALILPLLIAIFFLFAVMGASGYFLQVITDEKENRTMEIMLTSVSPKQMIGGKSLGLLAVGLTQLLVWISSAAIIWLVAKNFLDFLNQLQIPWDIFNIFALFFLPSYAIIAGLMICIGSVVTELQEGQQISGIINLIFTFPIFFAGLVFADPNSPILVFLSFWPTTSLMTIIMRWGFTAIPLWQIALSWLICLCSSIGIIWVASQLFRFGMLQYGQSISVKGVFSFLRQVNRS
jgi:ABC-2 type transport system permease protein